MPVVRAVERALAILACLSEDELRLVDLAQRLGLHKATVSRLLASLARADMVSRDAAGRYRLGPGVLMLTTRLLTRHRTLVDYLRAPLVRVWRVTRETVTVHVRAGLERVCVEELESPETIAFRSGVGSRVPIHVSSSGKVLLAFMDEAERGALLAQLPLTPITERTIVSRTRLAQELEKIRRVGHGISIGERTPGAASVSVPVLDATGQAVAAVSVIGPERRMGPATRRKYAALLEAEVTVVPLVLGRSMAVPRLAVDGRPGSRR
jgi:DNA-binding IclR family transcriptional regulator